MGVVVPSTETVPQDNGLEIVFAESFVSTITVYEAGVLLRLAENVNGIVEAAPQTP